MRLRWPVAASLAPVGVLVGALIVGAPTSVPNDVRLIDTPTTTAAPSTTTTEVVESEAPVPGAQETTTTAAGITTTANDGTLTAEERAAVTVLVANASSTGGVANTNAGILNSAGFVDTITSDAAQVPSSVVLYRPGFEAAGLLVAQVLGISEQAVAPLAGEPLTPIDDQGDVIVLVGADRAA